MRKKNKQNKKRNTQKRNVNVGIDAEIEKKEKHKVLKK